jgi:hypothetical protein
VIFKKLPKVNNGRKFAESGHPVWKLLGRAISGAFVAEMWALASTALQILTSMNFCMNENILL